MRTDVLVAGAGPVGLAMACELARYDLSVRIVDKTAERTDKSKALVVWSRTLELMDRMGCREKFVTCGLKVAGAGIYADHKRIGFVDMTGVATPYPFALMIPQSDTERLFEEHLTGFGVHVERQTALQQFAATADGVSCVLVHEDGSQETVEASWLLGCDGAHSVVRHQLGMEFHGETLLSNWALADLHLQGAPVPQEMSIGWHSDGIIALFPLSPTRYRIIANLGEASGPVGTGNRPDPTLEEIQQIIDRRSPFPMQASDPVWLAAFTINERKVKHYRAGRVFLAGDAAHIHSPAGGQGMNTGIQDACNLAWKLALVHRGLCTADVLLDSYSSERSRIADMILEATGKGTAMAVMQGEFKQSIRDHVGSLLLGFAPFTRMAANVLSEVAIGYPDSVLNGHSAHVAGGPRAGKRAPVRAEEIAVGAGNTPRFAVFAKDSEEGLSVLSKYEAFVETAIRPPYSDGGIWLVRPDGYVALVAKHDDWPAVDRYLAGLV
jgi:2-polyprenyl-6-methoxyphenol hydroxylase-like FAD-dependent oxidoreductase